VPGIIIPTERRESLPKRSASSDITQGLALAHKVRAFWLTAQILIDAEKHGQVISFAKYDDCIRVDAGLLAQPNAKFGVISRHLLELGYLRGEESRPKI
jgi:hypothetical protein